MTNGPTDAPIVSRHDASVRILPTLILLLAKRPGWIFEIKVAEIDMGAGHPLVQLYGSFDEGLHALEPNGEFRHVLARSRPTPEEASRPENVLLFVKLWGEAVTRNRKGRALPGEDG